jgi:SAM-dependent methyltransferase
VVDLGCGSGISARLLQDAGFRVVGIDLSEPLIHLAKDRVPDAEFRVGSFVTATIQPCIAVTAIGEVLNYAFDPANSHASREDVLRRIHAALVPNGLLVLDIAGPDRAPANGAHRTFREGSNWAVLVETEGDDNKAILTRRITTFRKQGSLYCRDFELHQLQLVDLVSFVDLLKRIGFSVQTLDGYGPQSLPPGLAAFLARKT